MHITRWTLLSVTLLGACAGREQMTVRKQAAAELSCSADTLQIDELPYQGRESKVLYRVHGCDKTQAYVTRCSLFGCKAKIPESLKLAKPVDDPENTRYTVEESERARDYKPPQPDIYKVLSECDKVVFLKQAEDPDDGAKMSLTAKDMMQIKGFKDDKLWIFDSYSSKTPSDHVSLDPARPTLHVDASCTRFKSAE